MHVETEEEREMEISLCLEASAGDQQPGSHVCAAFRLECVPGYFVQGRR